MQLAKYVQNNHVDSRKFTAFKNSVAQFQEQYGRPMAIEEAHDYCKTLFNDFKLIDLIVAFVRDSSDVSPGAVKE
jgi:hypothetical protein